MNEHHDDDCEDQSPLPIDFRGSLDLGVLPNVTLGNHSLMTSSLMASESPVKMASRLSAGRRSPVKTIKDYNQQVCELQKENFNLKLRIYYLEERMGQQYGSEQDVFKTNVELKVKIDHLSEELAEKQIYLNKAAQAVSTMTLNHQQAEDEIRQQCKVDYNRELVELRKELNHVIEECEKSRRQAEDAGLELEKIENELRQVNKYNQELVEKFNSAESLVETLESKLKDSENAMDGLEEMASNLRKQLERKDRDMKRLSVCFEDKSLDSVSILEPQHFQDKYEDQAEELDKLKKRVLDLEAELSRKDGKLENTERELDDKQKELDDKILTCAKYQKTIESMMKKICKIKSEDEKKDAKIKLFQEKLNETQECLEQAKQEKSQGLMQSLGKKQGEISNFQEQLKTAMEALTSSETAVEELQNQLKKERVEFESKLRNQAALFGVGNLDTNDEMAELQKSMADQNVKILELERELDEFERQNSKLKNMENELLDERDSRDRKISSLEREIQTLQLELQRNALRFGNVQQNTVHIERPSQDSSHVDVNVQLMPMNAMEDMRLLVDNLRQELLTLKVLQASLQTLLDAGGMSDALKDEIESVLKVYQQLEEGMHRNSQLHQCLLKNLQGNNAWKTFNDAATTPTIQWRPSISTSDSPLSLTSATQHDQTDVGGSRLSEPSGKGLLRSDLDSVPNQHLPLMNNSSHLSNPHSNYITSGDSIAPEMEETLTDVTFLNHSLTDDAKEGNLMRHSDSYTDANGFHQFFEPRRHDRLSIQHLDSDDDMHENKFMTDTSNGQKEVTESGTVQQNNLIDFFSKPQEREMNGVNQLQNLNNDSLDSGGKNAGRLSYEMLASNPNITRRSDSFLNVTSRGSIDVNNQSQCKANNYSEGNLEEELSSKTIEPSSPLHPDVVKSTRKRKDVIEESIKEGGESQGSASGRWAEKIDHKIRSEEQTQTSFDYGSRDKTVTNSNRVNEATVSGIPGEWQALVIHYQTDLNKALVEKQAAFTEMKYLQEKLEATENTVRQLSRKNKAYSVALDNAGINPPLKRRSSSEVSLPQSDCSSRQGSLHRGSYDKCDDMSSVMSGDVASMEKGRGGIVNGPTLQSFSAMSPSLLMASPSSSSKVCPENTVYTISPERLSSISGPHHPVTSQESQNTHFSCLSSMSLPYFGNNNHYQSADLFSNNEQLSSDNPRPNDTASNENVQDKNNSRLVNGSPFNSNLQYNSNDNGTDNPDLSNNSQQLMNNTLSADWGDRTSSDDPTMTSLLVTDYTFLHRRLTILSESLLAPGKPAVDDSFNNATISVDKLQSRLEHLERIIVMQKEEITVYESLLTSMGVPIPLVSSMGEETSNGSNEGDTKESLLRQHLIEIRKLRMRLEHLEVGPDQNQLLIFQTHTQQRIVQQEQTISKLQQEILEKEEWWSRKSMETEHKLHREKASLGQRIAALESEIKQDRILIDELEGVKDKLLDDLQQKIEEEKKLFEENGKLKLDKVEIEEDLVKREKEFLEMETSMFKLEIAKEEMEAEKAAIKADLEENEKQVMKFKSDADHFRENCQSLKEALRDKDESLQEQMLCLKKIAQEKIMVDENLTKLENELEEMKAEAEKLRQDVEEKKHLEENHSRLKEEYVQLKNFTDDEMSFRQKVLSQKSELEIEVTHLRKENSTLKMNSDKWIDELKKKLEIEVKGKLQLGEEVSNLRTMFDKRCNLESELRIRISDLESGLRQEELERTRVEEELTEKIEKVKKRDKQCQFLCDQFGKLDAAYTKQNKALKDKIGALNSMKKQIQLYEQTLSTLSQGNHQDTLKQLFEELVLTKKQVGELLNRLEESSNQLLSFPEINLNALSAMATSSSSATTTTTSTESVTTETNHLQSSQTSQNIVTSSSDISSSLKTCFGSSSSIPDMMGGGDTGVPDLSSFKNYEGSSLCAVLKLDEHEKARKQASECLVSLSGLEARIDDRLKVYKAKSVTESMDYSTWREAGISLHQIKTCMNEVSKLISLAWITELPPVSDQGRFYDQENERLKCELAELKSKCDVLDHATKDQRGKLHVSKQRQKDWEHSVCRQLLKTTQDLEQAKENLDLSRGILQQVNTDSKVNSQLNAEAVINRNTMESPSKSPSVKQKLHISFQSEVE